MVRAAALAIAVALAIPASALAQAVAGTLVGPGGQPIEGALVSLISDDGSVAARNITSATGRFLLRAPVPGAYHVRAERIGFATTEGPVVSLASDETAPYRMEVSETAIRLRGIEVESETRCVRDPRRGAQVAMLWDEARKALTATRVAEESALYRYDISISVRELRRDTVVGVTRTSRQVLTEVPLASEDADTLSARGFVWFEADTSIVWNAPDATVLLSDVFLDDHCFRARSGEGIRPGQVGLSFEPVAGRRLPEVAGTFWLDRETAELREIEFRWVNLPWPGVERDARGTVQFERGPTGAWFVRRAGFRMPRVLEPDDGPTYRVVAYREKIFEVEGFSPFAEAGFEMGGAATIRGAVTDGLVGGPLPGAVVYLSGTDREVVADSAGRYSFAGLRPGLYSVAFVHPWLDRLGVHTPAVRVEVGAGAEAVVDLATPPSGEVLARICPEMPGGETGWGVLLVTAVPPDEGPPDPAGGAETPAEEPPIPTAAPAPTEIRLTWSADRRGREVVVVTLDLESGPHFVVCGVPRGRDVRIRVGSDDPGLLDRPSGDVIRIPEEGPRAVVVEVPLGREGR